MKVIRKFHAVSRGLVFEIQLDKDEVIAEKDIIQVGNTHYIVRELDFWRDLSEESNNYSVFAIVEVKRN